MQKKRKTCTLRKYISDGLAKKPENKYISTYENEANWAGLFRLGIELQAGLFCVEVIFVFSLTGQVKAKYG